MSSNFFSFSKMQFYSLSQIVWLQLLSIALFPMFFTQMNASNDLANTLSYATGLMMLSYLLLRNFAFNDAKYKTKLLFSILPVTPDTIIAVRGTIVYLFCIIATPLLTLFSYATHALKPELFAIIRPHIQPFGLLLVSVFMPIEFLIFYFFDAQKADIIGALVLLPYMGLMVLLHNYFMNGYLWVVVLIIATFTNVVCFNLSTRLYKNRLS